MFKYLEKEEFLSMMLLLDIIAFLLIISKFFSRFLDKLFLFLVLLFYIELFLVLIQYIVVRLLIFLLTYFLLYTINETGKNDITKGRLKIILRYAIFYLSIRVFASSSLFLMFT